MRSTTRSLKGRGSRRWSWTIRTTCAARSSGSARWASRESRASADGTIARQLIDAELVQDLYLTTSPKDGGEPNTPLYPKPLKGRTIVRKEGTGADAGVVFEHLRL
jgi:hypothetical protein